MNAYLLLIDDDDSHRLLVRRALKELTLTILEARSPEEARQTFAAGQATLSLVILDMNLNGVSSIELLGDLRAVAPFEKLPIIVLSTSALEKDVCAAYEFGASCYLVKTIDPGEFRKNIEKAAQFFLTLG